MDIHFMFAVVIYRMVNAVLVSTFLHPLIQPENVFLNWVVVVENPRSMTVYATNRNQAKRA
jgi:hypothetical protein